MSDAEVEVAGEPVALGRGVGVGRAVARMEAATIEASTAATLDEDASAMDSAAALDADALASDMDTDATLDADTLATDAALAVRTAAAETEDCFTTAREEAATALATECADTRLA